MLGILITLLIYAFCVLLFVFMGYATEHRISILAIVGCAVGSLAAWGLVYFDASNSHLAAPWRIIEGEFLKHGELRVPFGIILPLTICGGMVAIGCPYMFASRYENPKCSIGFFALVMTWTGLTIALWREMQIAGIIVSALFVVASGYALSLSTDGMFRPLCRANFPTVEKCVFVIVLLPTGCVCFYKLASFFLLAISTARE